MSHAGRGFEFKRDRSYYRMGFVLSVALMVWAAASENPWPMLLFAAVAIGSIFGHTHELERAELEERFSAEQQRARHDPEPIRLYKEDLDHDPTTNH